MLSRQSQWKWMHWTCKCATDSGSESGFEFRRFFGRTLGCVLQDVVSTENQVDFYGKAQKFRDWRAAWNSEKLHHASSKFGKEGVHWQVWSNVLIFMKEELLYSEIWGRIWGRTSTKSWDRQFVVDSRASLHKLSRKDLKSAELDTLRVSRTLAMVITANGEVQTNEKATVYVHDLDLFVTVQIIEGTLCSPIVWVSRNTSRTPCLHACRDSVSPYVLFICTVTLVTRHTMRDWSARSFISTTSVLRSCARHRLRPHNPFPLLHFCWSHLPHKVEVCYTTMYLKIAKIHDRVTDSRISTPPQVFESMKIELGKNLWRTRKIRWLMTRTIWRKFAWNILL